MNNKIKILYVLGSARSGSTLLGRLLGQLNGFLTVGELKWIWRLVFGEDVLCECGIPFRRCAFWTDVFHRAFGGMEKVDARIDELSTSMLRLRRLHLLLWPGISRQYREDIQYYSHVVSRLCRAVQEVSNCRVLVDTSKLNRDCIVLGRIPDFDLHVVHIVRDSRAVAYSWLRKKLRPQFYLHPEFMPQLRIKGSAREWLFTNAMSEALRPCLRHYMRVRYEDLVADPRGTLTRICSAIREPKPALEFLDGQTAHLCKGHTVAGNPMRFQDGPVPIEPDLEWVEKLSEDEKAVVTRITGPLLFYYGYLRGGATRGTGCERLPQTQRCSTEGRSLAMLGGQHG